MTPGCCNSIGRVKNDCLFALNRGQRIQELFSPSRPECLYCFDNEILAYSFVSKMAI